MPQQNVPIGTLVDMYERGEMRLPEIQRHYVWRAPRVRDLLDSLWPGISYVLWILKLAYREFEERVGEIKAPRGAKREQVLGGISRLVGRVTAGFSIRELERA